MNIKDHIDDNKKTNEGDYGNNDVGNEDSYKSQAPILTSHMANANFSIIRKTIKDESRVPLWLITFTDVMALMLTFFVLLYSMSTLQEDKWEDMSRGLTYKQNQFDAAAFNAGSQDVISLDKIDKRKALHLDYVKTLISGLLEQKNINDVLLIENGKRLIISLPSKVLFESGKADIEADGKKIIFELGGVLSRIKNRIEVVGNTDPRPITGAGTYTTNWQLSLARAVSVSRVLRDVGYNRNITVRGISSARFDELSEEISENNRYRLSRRVDIVVDNDNGYRKNAFDIK